MSNHRMAKAPGLLFFLNNISSNDKCLDFLFCEELLSDERECDSCNISMKLRASTATSDGKIFYCTKCKNTCGIRRGSLFEVNII